MNKFGNVLDKMVIALLFGLFVMFMLVVFIAELIRNPIGMVIGIVITILVMIRKSKNKKKKDEEEL